MISEANARTVLEDIAKKARIEKSDVLLLGAIIHQLFSERSPIATAFDKLVHEMQARFPGAAQPPLPDEELRHLARSASRLMDSPKTPDQSDPKGFEDRVAQIVDHRFYESQPYSFAKWVLLISLVVIFGGSVAYAGFSLTLWSRAGEARDQLRDATEKYNAVVNEIKQKGEDLQRLQENTIKNVRNTIEEKAQQLDKELASFVENKKKTLGEKITAAERSIEEQKGKVVASAAAFDAFVEGQKGKLTTDVAAANVVIEAQKSKVSADVAAANAHLEGQKKNFATNLDAASAVIEDQKSKFAAGLALLLEQAKGKIDPAIAESLLVLTTAADNGAQKINGEAQRKIGLMTQNADAELVRIHEVAEQKRSELDLASGKDARTLNAELNKKLAELQERSRDAGEAIDTVARSVAARERGFVSAMDERLSEWDQRVSLEFKRVDDVARTAGSLEARIREISPQTQSLLTSFKAAFDVANELRSGTATWELPMIGKVLERSAISFIASLAIALFSMFLALFTLARSVPRQEDLRKPSDRSNNGS